MTVPIFSSVDSSKLKTNNLSELWKKIEKNQLRNEKAKQKVDRLFTEYNETLTTYEKQITNAHCAWIKHLLSFFTKKNLKKDTQIELLYTIEAELSECNDFPHFYDQSELNALFQEFNACYDKVHEKETKAMLDAMCNEFESFVKDMFGLDIELADKDRVRATLSSGDPLAVDYLIDEFEQAFLVQHTDASPEADITDDEWRDFEFDYFDSDKAEAINIQEVFRGTQLNKMYKRIARVIHPDKEPDPTKKEEKHSLMQALADVKRSNDVITLVKMFLMYVPDEVCDFDESTLLRIEHLLEMRIRELNYEHRNIFNGQGVKSLVWKQFSAPSKKKKQEKIQEFILLSEQSTSEYYEQINSVSNVNQLDRYLETFNARLNFPNV